MNGDVHKAGQISPRNSTLGKELSSGVLTEESFFHWNSFQTLCSVIKTGEGKEKMCVRQITNLKMKCLPEDAGSQLC